MANQRHIIWTAAWATIVGLLLPAIFGGKDDLWGQFIAEYQTLLAGILAVFAAAVAVSQSAATDAAQERRHREQMFLTQRRDLYAVRRLTNDLFIRLKYLADRARDFSAFEIDSANEGWSREAKTTYLSVLNSAWRLFDKLKGLDDLERGLFDAKLEAKYTLFIRQLEDFFRHFPQADGTLADNYPNSDHAPAPYDQAIRTSCIALEHDSRDLLAEFKRWLLDIENIYSA